MQFKIETYFNPYIPAGASRVDAVLTITSSGTATSSDGVIGLIVDTSGSMQGDRIFAVKHATRTVIQMLPEQCYFFVVSFANMATVVYPLAQATPANKAAADAQVRRIEAGGGTHMSAGLMAARQEFMKQPGAIHQALFLTDGKNMDDDARSLDTALASCQGVFQCDCRGVGTDWQVAQLQRISRTLLGTAQIIAEPAAMEADFRATVEGALSRGVNNVRLRLWTPKSAKVVSVKQVSPDIVVLTDKAAVIDDHSIDFPTGAWGQEARDYYVGIEMANPGEVGDEMLAARASLLYTESGQEQEVKDPTARVIASWTDDDSLSARINDHVAHYTGQEELADAIKEGLEAREQGDLDTATRMLGKAAKLAQESQNEETTARLRKVVDIVDAHEGTVRLKANVKKADEMDLDLGSTRTTRLDPRKKA